MKPGLKAAARRKPRDNLPPLALLRDFLMACHSVVGVHPNDNCTLSVQQVEVLVDALDAILDDRDIRDKYWEPLKGRPKESVSTDRLWRELLALNQIEIDSPNKAPRPQLIEKLAAETGLSFEQIEAAYKRYLKPPRDETRVLNSQGSK